MSIEAGLRYFEFTKTPTPVFTEDTIHPYLIDGVETVRRLLPFSASESAYLEATVKGTTDKTSLDRISLTVNQAAKRTDEKLATVAMGVSDYFAAYRALHSPWADGYVESLIAQTEARLNLSAVQPTVVLESMEKIEKKHSKLLGEILEEVPVAKKGEQKFIVVSGPFAAGKSETVHSRLDTNGVLEIDLDILRGRLLRGYDQTDQKDIQKIRTESWVFSDVLLKKALETGRSVLIQSALHRERWLNDVNFAYASKNKISLNIYMVLRPLSDCLVRNVKRGGRTVTFKDLAESTGGMRLLPRMLQKFGSSSHVVLMDYYPLIEASTGLSCVFGRKDYNELIDFAKSKSGGMKVEPQPVDITIEEQ